MAFRFVAVAISDARTISVLRLRIDLADPTNVSEQDATFGGADPLVPISEDIVDRTRATRFVYLAVALFVVLISTSVGWWMDRYVRATPRDDGREVKFMRLKKWRSRSVLAYFFISDFGLILFGAALSVYTSWT